VAFARAAEELFSETDEVDPTWLPQRRLLRRHPALVGHNAAAYAAIERDLVVEIARRLPDNPPDSLQARVLATTLLAALRTATEYWLEVQDRPLREVVADALRYTQQ
jgi:hypothetical protein